MIIALNILKPVCSQDVAVMNLRGYKFIEYMIKLIATEKFPQQVHIDALTCLELAFQTRQVRNLIEDLIQIPNTFGWTILATALAPPSEKNVCLHEI